MSAPTVEFVFVGTSTAHTGINYDLWRVVVDGEARAPERCPVGTSREKAEQHLRAVLLVDQQYMQSVRACDQEQRTARDEENERHSRRLCHIENVAFKRQAKLNAIKDKKLWRLHCKLFGRRQ